MEFKVVAINGISYGIKYSDYIFNRRGKNNDRKRNIIKIKSY